MEFIEQCRELGRARLALIERCNLEKSWKTDWEPPRLPFPIAWGECWKGIFEIPTTDYAGDLGFFMDVLGFDVNTISADYAMLMSPDLNFMFSIVPATPDRPAPSRESIRLEFMAQGIDTLAAVLEERLVPVSPLNAEWGEDNEMRTLQFQTPSGLQVKIWGFPSR